MATDGEAAATAAAEAAAEQGEELQTQEQPASVDPPAEEPPTEEAKEGPLNSANKENETDDTSDNANKENESGNDKILDTADKEPAAPDANFQVGGRVVVKGLADKPQLEGITGTLVEKKWKGNWVVDLDDEEGKKRRLRRRWLINANNLEVTERQEMKKYYKELGRPKQQYYIVGSWNTFVPRRMLWDHDRCVWTFEVRMTNSAYESFQIWLERDRTKAVHPDTANAGNYVPWELCGPDDKGEGKHWSFGQEQETPGPDGKGKGKGGGKAGGPAPAGPGSRGAAGLGEGRSGKYEIRLRLWEDESPQAVEWEDMEVAKKKEEQSSEQKTQEASKETFCPKKHKLKAFRPSMEGYTCSKCSRTCEKGVELLSCRICDFDLCNSCSSSSSSSSSTATTAATTATTATAAATTAETATAAGEDKAGAASGDASEALKVGDRIVINASGPFKGKLGTVIKVDEDGDPAVRVDSGEAKLFYRVDVVKSKAAAAAPARPAIATVPAPTLSAKGAGRPVGGAFGPSSLAGRGFSHRFGA